MAKRKYNRSFYGMRLVNYRERVVGLIWEEAGLDNITLKLYYINDYEKYICEDLMNFSLDSILIGKYKEEGLICLKKIARHKDSSYDIFIEEGLYKGILELYKQKRKQIGS